VKVIRDLDAWRTELMETGDIPQDADESADPAEAERRTLRYIELLEMVEGDEPDEVFLALVDSMQAKDDYEVYQTTYGVAHERFAPERVGQLLLTALQRGFVERDPDRAGDWLGQLAFLGSDSAAVQSFNAAWSCASQDSRDRILAFVLENEDDGWLSAGSQVGVLRPVV
jgi:TPR repeat protein